jgi:hypothetical protein
VRKVSGCYLLQSYLYHVPHKVKAVPKPELFDCTDVIVCPITSYRRFAEWLAGGMLSYSLFSAVIHVRSFSGDYDGDKGVVFYDPDIVTPFKNADERYSYEPEGLADNFSRNTEKVVDVLERIQGDSPTSQIRELQK